MSDAAQSTAPEGMREAGYTHSDSFPDVLADAGVSLLVSTYQAGQLVSIGTHEGRVQFDFHRFDQAMGIAVAPDQVAVGAKGQVWFLRDQPDLAPRLEPAGSFDRCFLASSSLVTGGIQGHELAWGTGVDGEPELWIVNTLFSCLAGLDPAYSFVPRWRPPFISALAAEDRCHLNGLAMRDGRPAFVTVMARSDTAGGWRDTKLTSGTVLHVPSGEVVTTGLSMPHSPRWHDGQLYVLDSGMGHLQRVDVATGRREMVAALPGYARGLAIHGDLAFVGLSKIRETAVFGGVPIAEFHDQLRCGIGVVRLSTGDTVATLQFTSVMEEIFDVQVVTDSRCTAIGNAPGDGDEIWVVPQPRPL